MEDSSMLFTFGLVAVGIVFVVIFFHYVPFFLWLMLNRELKSGGRL